MVFHGYVICFSSVLVLTYTIIVLGNSLLLIAAQNGRADIIDDLLLGGADVNLGNNHKNSAIHLTAQNGWTAVLRKLLKAKKININFKDLHANTALHLAAQNGQTGVRFLSYFARYVI